MSAVKPIAQKIQKELTASFIVKNLITSSNVQSKKLLLSKMFRSSNGETQNMQDAICGILKIQLSPTTFFISKMIGNLSITTKITL
jgi:hypothetical protein